MMPSTAPEDLTDLPLNIVLRGDSVMIILPDGAQIAMTLSAAERSAQRLSDALAFARNQHPKTQCR